jgi:hypothetical protein
LFGGSAGEDASMHLMHVKCIHELCSLLDHIPSYLIVYKDLDLIAIDFGGFINNPLSFVYNTTKQFSLFFIFLTFRDLPDIKRTKTFCKVIFREIQELERKKSMGDATWGKREITMWAKLLAMWWGPSRASCVVSMQSFTPDFVFPKTK